MSKKILYVTVHRGPTSPWDRTDLELREHGEADELRLSRVLP